MDAPPTLKRPREEDAGFGEKRLRKDPADELTSNVCGDICSLDPRSIEDIAYISNPIVIEFEKIDKLRNLFLSTVFAMITEQLSKLHVVSDLVIICNAKNMVVGKYVIEYIHQKLQDAITASEWNKVKIILKFVATLAPIITEVRPLFQQILQFAIDSKLDQLYYGVCIAIPYLFANSQDVELPNELIELALNYTVELVPLELYNNGIGADENQVYSSIFAAVKQLQGEDKLWTALQGKLFTHRQQVTAPIIEEALQNNPISKEMVQHSLPQVALPDEPKPLKLSPRYSHIYNHQTLFDTVPPITTYQGLFFRDIIADTVNLLHFAPVEAGITMYQLDLAFPIDLAPELTLIEQLEMIDKDNQLGENQPPLLTWKTEDVAVENIVNLLLLLPNPEHHCVFYFKVLLVICHESPANVAPVFGRAIRYLYLQLETMDFELRTRFADWMLIQLSNFDFSWKWDEWVNDSQELDRNHPKINFIANLIGKEIRLSLKKRIKELFIAQDEEGEVVNLEEFYKYLETPLYPEIPVAEFIRQYDDDLLGNSFADLLTAFYNERASFLEEKPLVSAQDEVVFPYTAPDMPLRDIADRVYDFLVSTYPRTNPEFKELCNDVVEAAMGQGLSDPTRYMVNLLVQTYCYVGSRSIYSVVSLFSRDLAKLKFLMGLELEEDFEQPALSDEEVAQRQRWFIDAVVRVWYHHPQMVFLILEHVVDFDLVAVNLVLERYFAHDLVVGNYACYDSVVRMRGEKTDASLFELAVTKINEGGNEWLTKDYYGLAKAWYRHSEDKSKAKEALDTVEDLAIKEKIDGWQ